jgi:hypothetical protein
VRNGSSGRRPGESDTFVVGNVLGQLPGSDFDGGAEVVLAKERNHRAANVAHASVINDRFEAIAYLDAIFAVVGREEQEDAGVLLFCPYAEVFEEIDGIVFDGAIIERTHGDDGELRGGFLVEFGAE